MRVETIRPDLTETSIAQEAGPTVERSLKTLELRSALLEKLQGSIARPLPHKRIESGVEHVDL